ncbi:MAG: GNAT family N-acetyltransferase [Acidimicrobiia bacterium]
MIRWAVPGDAPVLADVHVTTWQHAYRGIFPDEFLDTLDRGLRETWWRRALEGGARVHVAEAQGVAGFCFPGPADDEGWGEIYSIYVHPEHWDAGHGWALLEAGMATLREEGFERALLWVLEGNERGRRFYQRQGWVLGRPMRLEDIGGTQVTELRYEVDLRGAL